jgi:hypothetical protein
MSVDIAVESELERFRCQTAPNSLETTVGDAVSEETRLKQGSVNANTAVLPSQRSSESGFRRDCVPVGISAKPVSLERDMEHSSTYEKSTY